MASHSPRNGPFSREGYATRLLRAVPDQVVQTVVDAVQPALEAQERAGPPPPVEVEHIPRRGAVSAPHIVTEENQRLVRILAANGVPQKTIALEIGTTLDVMRHQYRDELDDGYDRTKAAIGVVVVRKALAGDLGAAKFWLLTRGGAEWRPTPEAAQALAAAAQAAAESTGPRIYLPHNFREAMAQPVEGGPVIEGKPEPDGAAR